MFVLRFAPVAFASLITGTIVLLAADLGHAVVAALTRLTSASSAYALYSHTAAVPAMLGALLCAAVIALGLFGDALARVAGYRADWLLTISRSLTPASFVKLAPIVFMLQLAVLVSMERIEQVAAFGHPLGFAATLGAAPLVAVSIHFVVALFVTALTFLAARALASAAIAAARAIMPLLARIDIGEHLTQSLSRVQDSRALLSLLAPLARHIASRPPPIPAA